MKKIYSILIISICVIQVSIAQNFRDAIRYSTYNTAITARSIATGNTLGGVGGEFSTLSSNPAGLGTYRHSEFVITPGSHVFKTNATLNGEERESKKTKMNFNNIGLVFNSNRGGSWKSFNFGIGVNQLNKFNQRISYTGMQTGSITQQMLENAQGKSTEEFNQYSEGLAWDAYAIFPKSNEENQYGTDFDENPNTIEHTENIWRYGNVREMVIGVGGNYDGKLMVGATLGVPFLNFEEIKRYHEEDVNNEVDFFNYLDYEERLRTTGVGVNGKLGILYKPISSLRVGLAIHTPTLYTLTENYSRSLGYNYTASDFNGTREAETEDGTFNYELTTPWRVIGNVSYLIKRIAIISAEVEWVDHASSLFVYDEAYVDSEFTANQSIEENLQSTVRLKIGADVGNENFRFRAGYGLIGSAFADIKQSTNTIGLGVGLIQDKFYLDLGYQIRISDSEYSPYTLTDGTQPVVDLTERVDKLLFTVGFKF